MPVLPERNCAWNKLITEHVLQHLWRDQVAIFLSFFHSFSSSFFLVFPLNTVSEIKTFKINSVSCLLVQHGKRLISQLEFAFADVVIIQRWSVFHFNQNFLRLGCVFRQLGAGSQDHTEADLWKRRMGKKCKDLKLIYWNDNGKKNWPCLPFETAPSQWN